MTTTKEREQAEQREQTELEAKVQADLLLDLWRAVDAQLNGSERHDEPNQRVRDVLRELGPPPPKEEEDKAPVVEELEEELKGEPA